MFELGRDAHGEWIMRRKMLHIYTETKAKGLTAPRLSPEKIDAVITGEDYHVFPGTTLTVCCLKLRNGFAVTGESATASPENFDVELGRKIARSNARDKIWALEGYALRERLAEGTERGLMREVPLE